MVHINSTSCKTLGIIAEGYIIFNTQPIGVKNIPIPRTFVYNRWGKSGMLNAVVTQAAQMFSINPERGQHLPLLQSRPSPCPTTNAITIISGTFPSLRKMNLAVISGSYHTYDGSNTRIGFDSPPGWSAYAIG